VLFRNADAKFFLFKAKQCTFEILARNASERTEGFGKGGTGFARDGADVFLATKCLSLAQALAASVNAEVYRDVNAHCRASTTQNTFSLLPKNLKEVWSSAQSFTEAQLLNRFPIIAWATEISSFE